MPFFECHRHHIRHKTAQTYGQSCFGREEPLHTTKPVALYFLKGTGTHLKMSAIPLCTDVYTAIRI